MLAHRNEVNATAFIADQDAASASRALDDLSAAGQHLYLAGHRENCAKDEPAGGICIRATHKKRILCTVKMAELLFSQPAGTADGEITVAHTKKLEEDIIAQPATWLVVSSLLET